MLKHASNSNGSAINGHIRNTKPSTRNIHLRPQQPLNISTLCTNGFQTTATSTANTITNSGPRIPTTLLNVSAPVAPTSTTILPSVSTTATTPPIVNGLISNNLNNCHHLTPNNNAFTYIPNINNNNNYSNLNNINNATINPSTYGPGAREALTSLGLLCLVSLLLALLSLIFLLKISPNGRDEVSIRSATEDFVIVYDITLSLCALSLSLNLCCLLVCSIQFLFAVKLVRFPMFDGRNNKYLEKSRVSRTCAVGGFFLSIPIFLTGIILYTFNNFHSTPAVISSVLIGIGIIFCGGAMVHNVFVWQKEKTLSYRNQPINMSLISPIGPITPPFQFLNHTSHSNQFSQTNLQLHQTNSLTPVSPNHSQSSSNPLGSGPVSSSFLIRPSTATPPTPKSIANGCLILSGREASGSVSPGVPPPLDISTVTNTSLHELSTLV